MGHPAIKQNSNVVWEPQPGSQTFFMNSPIWETLYEGTRGPGKTDALLMDFAQHVDQGHGQAWRGILFREEFPQLEDVIAKSQKWFPKIFPRARFLEGRKMKWVFPGGEELLFRAARRLKDYDKYHGHEYPWVGWEELTNWATGDLYEKMKSICRSSDPNVPRKYRATSNPYGVGHSWVKNLFVDAGPPGTIMKGKMGRGRVRVHGTIWENKFIMENDPEYLYTLMNLRDENLKKAWLHGSWDIVAGGYFADVWDPRRHYLDPFEIPRNWKWRLSFDWGSAAPASLGVWAISNGEQPDGQGRQLPFFPRGSAIRVDELYTVKRDSNNVAIPNKGKGWTNKKLGKEVAKKVKVWQDRGATFSGNVADPSIFVEGGGQSIYQQMKEGFSHENVSIIFEKADNERVPGWGNMKEGLVEAAKDHPEGPGMWIMSRCLDWKRTVPVLQRDETDMDDIDTDLEDHPADETRYLWQSLSSKGISQTDVTGL